MPQDRIAEGYSDWKGWSERPFAQLTRGDADYFEREVRQVVRGRRVERVLEIGFGNGTFLAYCRSRSWQVTGVELLPELVEAARSAGFDAIASDRLDDFPDASADLVFAFDVFEHIPPESSVEFLRTLRRKLRPGGALVLRYPNADTWIGNPFQHGDVTHVNAIGGLKMGYYADVVDLDLLTLRATKRRGFAVSPIHGIHAMTAGLLAKLVAAVQKAIYFPDIRVVLSASSVIAVLTPRADPDDASARRAPRGETR